MQPKLTVIDSLSQVTGEVIDHFERHDDKFFPPLSERGGIDSYLESLFAIDGRLLLCHAKERLVAVMGFGFDHPQWKTYFQYIAIEPEYQGQGLPQKMVNAAIEMAVAKGETRIVARTWSTNLVMLRFFSLQGFIHFDTIYDDRGKGIHTYLFTKLIVPPGFEKPVSRLALIGGMGTYSTGHFIRTLTGIPRTTKKEQGLLPFVLVNEPAIPDRTDSILNNRLEEMIEKVSDTVGMVHFPDMSHILFLCFTLHPYLDRLAIDPFVEKISLISILQRMMRNNNRRTLLVATKGTYSNRLFYDFGFVIPDEKDIPGIHGIITDIKSGTDPAYFRDRVRDYAAAYDCASLALGCTDLHGMFGFDRKYRGVDIIDPLLELVLMLQTARVTAARDSIRVQAAAKLDS